MKYFDLLNTGVLWAINRYIFHPRGKAMYLIVDPEKEESRDWGIIDGIPGEPMVFDPAIDDEGFQRFEKFLSESHIHEPGTFITEND